MDCKQPKPDNFREINIKTTHNITTPIQSCWEFLCSMDTFKQPWWSLAKVEFITPGNSKPTFSAGTFTNHHGPLLSANGIISKMDAPHYRDMDYFYGSYIFSFRFFRPTRLQFWLSENNNETTINTAITFYIHGSIPRWAEALMTFNWRLMMRALIKTCRKKALR